MKCLTRMVDSMIHDMLCCEIYASKSTTADSPFEKRDLNDDDKRLKFQFEDVRSKFYNKLDML